MTKEWFPNLLILLKHQVLEHKLSSCFIIWVLKIKQRPLLPTPIVFHLLISLSFIVQNQLLERNLSHLLLIWQQIKETQICLHKMVNLMNSSKEQANTVTLYCSNASETLLNSIQIVMIHLFFILKIMLLWFNNVEKTQISCLSFLVPWYTFQLTAGTKSSKRLVSLNLFTTILLTDLLRTILFLKVSCLLQQFVEPMISRNKLLTHIWSRCCKTCLELSKKMMRWFNKFWIHSSNSCSLSQPVSWSCIKLKWFLLYWNFWVTRIQILKDWLMPF